jgi:outer membrane receptor protein involved in Fe transport
LADINSYGGTIGVDVKVFGNFDLGANYTYADLDFDRSAFPDFATNFNTPNHKVKASFGNTALFENFGFNINYRWNDAYFWENSFADGNIPSYNILDAQVNYSVPGIKSIFKLGGSNILGEEYFSAIGTGAVGSIFYVSWTVNP